MRGFSPELMDILRLLENYPMKSYSELAKKAGVSAQTFIRRVEKLKLNDIIREVHSSLNPENLLLERYVIFFMTKSIEQIKFLELSCDVHPYTASRNRIFGQEYGLYAVFDIPKGSYDLLKSFLEFMLGREFYYSSLMYKTTGLRISYPQPFYNNIVDIDEFDIEGYFSQSIPQTGNVGRESKPSSLEFHPIQLLILRDITTNMRIPMSQLLEKYISYLQLPKKEESYYSLPKGFKPYLEDFFSSKRTKNAVYIDFKKKYHSIVKNYVDKYWLGVNRKYFEMFIRFGYVIHKITKREKENLFNLLQKEQPPFEIYMEDLGDKIFLALSLPPYYQTRFAYFMKETFKNFTSYLLDSFGYNAVIYRFYIHNYDIENHKWRDDREWMLEDVIKGIDSNLTKKQYRRVSDISG